LRGPKVASACDVCECPPVSFLDDVAALLPADFLAAVEAASGGSRLLDAWRHENAVPSAAVLAFAAEIAARWTRGSSEVVSVIRGAVSANEQLLRGVPIDGLP